MNTSLINIKSCSFIGHRKINITNAQEQKLKAIIEDLIINNNVSTFLFGSKSEFDSLCHSIVSDLKSKYPSIKRIKYTCKSESCLLENEKEKWENILSKPEKQKITLLGYEEEFEHKTKYSSGKASYIERNKAMIDDSDFCIFYYNKDYIPTTKTNSGTKICYDYSLKKKKPSINLYKK